MIALLLAVTAVRTAVAQDPIPEIIVDINGASMGATLPFDVPFRLAGEVEATAQMVDVRVQKVDEKTVLTDQDPGWTTVTSSVWKRIDGTMTSDAKQRFHVWMPALDPDEYYMFRFSVDHRPTAAQRDAFTNAARTRIVRSIFGLPLTTLSQSQEDDLRLALRTELGQLIATTVATGATIAPGGVFEENEISTGLHNIFSVAVHPLRDAQLAVVRQHAPFAAKASSLLLKLDASLGDPILDIFFRELRSAAATNPSLTTLRTILDGNARLIELTNLLRNDLARLAGGQALDPPIAVDLTTITDPVAAASYRLRLVGLNRDLESLKELIRTFTDPSGRHNAILASVTTLTPANIGAAAALVAPGAAFDLAAGESLSLSGDADLIATALATLMSKAAGVADLVEIQWRRVRAIRSSTVQKYSTRQSNYLSADAGLVWVPGLDRYVPYAGTNIYFRPVNKDAPLRAFTWANCGDEFLRRFAVVLGFTLKGLDDASLGRDNLFGAQSGVVGVGMRLLSHIRLGAGMTVFRARDPNDLFSTTMTPHISFYTSLSFDVDVANTSIAGWLTK